MEKTVDRFSEAAKSALADQGYYIHTLTGQPLHKFGGGIIESQWHRNTGYYQFELTTSILSETTFDPITFVIPNSSTHSFDVQFEMIREYEKRLAKKIPDVRAIVGSITDYVELISLHLKRKPQDRLLGRHQNIRIATRIFQHGFLYLGPVLSSASLYIDHGDSSMKDANISIAPLIIPAVIN